MSPDRPPQDANAPTWGEVWREERRAKRAVKRRRRRQRLERAVTEQFIERGKRLFEEDR
jgi:hypothetical protein